MNYHKCNGCNGLLGGGSPSFSGEGVGVSATGEWGLSGGLAEMPRTSLTTKIDGECFSVRCFWSSAGKLLRKEERGPFGRTVWTYSFDARGHLLESRRDGIVVERYTYDESGRRTADHLAWLKEPRQFIYYYDGSLIRLDDECLAWTEQGQLKTIYDRSRRCEYNYGQDTRLDSVFLSSGKVIGYEYGRELMPVRVTEDSEVVAEHEWEDLLRLTRSIDIRNGLVYTFSYGKGRAPESVTITGKLDAVRAATGIHAERLALYVGVDQVESIRVLATPDGRPVKYVDYDSFGNVTRDTRPELRFPLGFACGLNDPYTGFVRFGFRDYHPLVGRFTAKDPAMDMRGDGDLWAYCVDDPVSRFDFTGLWTQETFDEAQVNRDTSGRFSSTGNRQSNLSERSKAFVEKYPGAINEIDEAYKEGSRIIEPYTDQSPLQSPDGTRQHYVIAKRPLEGASLLYGFSALYHAQLIADDGTNIGRFADGIRPDSEKYWETYEYKEDNRKYDAELIEEAVEIYNQEKDIVSEQYSQIVDGSDKWLGSANDYKILAQDCQRYVEDIIKIAEGLAKIRKRSLLVK